ncbi:MAG: DegT/DnrJ/EryC1/StrS family aminotransferase [Magnetospirillum sp.]|nr:DegT/DnrJ/EryC1/StrS family aminotransferase [Magnetospirillum sp.]
MPFSSISPARLRLYGTPWNFLAIARDMLFGRFARGGEVEALESYVANFVRMPHAIAMPTARAGIYAAIKALIRPGQAVVLCPYTIVDVVNMVICAGGRPVFADSEPDGYNIDPKAVARLLDTTPDVGAVMVTHFYGELCAVEEIAALCRARGVPLIEDAAQAYGAASSGVRAGAFGDVGIFSFGLYKNVNAIYGGMAVVRDDEVARRVRAEIADWPVQPTGGFLPKLVKAAVVDALTRPLLFKLFAFRLFRFAYLRDVKPIANQLRVDFAPEIKRELPASYKIRMSPAQARAILRQLDAVDARSATRIANAKRYHDGLEGLPIVRPKLRADGSSIYTYYCPAVADRPDFVRFLQARGRDAAENYHRNCADLPIFADYAADCPNARKMSERLVYLPSYPGLRAEDIDATTRAIRAYFAEKST